MCLVRPPPDHQLNTMTMIGHLLEVVDLVGVGHSVWNDFLAARSGNGVCVHIHVIRVDSITTLDFGSLDTSSHDRFDVGQTRRGPNVEPPFIPLGTHFVIIVGTFSVLVDGDPLTAVASRGEFELVIPETCKPSCPPLYRGRLT